MFEAMGGKPVLQELAEIGEDDEDDEYVHDEYDDEESPAREGPHPPGPRSPQGGKPRRVGHSQAVPHKLRLRGAKYRDVTLVSEKVLLASGAVYQSRPKRRKPERWSDFTGLMKRIEKTRPNLFGMRGDIERKDEMFDSIV